MKTQVFKPMAILLFLTTLAITVSANFERNEYRRWPANQVDGLKIENQFGNIKFVSTRTDSVTISVKITMKNLPQNRAQQLANQINLRFWITDGIVNARTEFGENFKTNQEFMVEYTINIPENRHLDVLNKYGNITLGNLNSEGKFTIQYGNFHSQNLNAPNGKEITLDMSYGNASINSANELNAKLSYSKIDAGHIDKATINSRYSIIRVNSIDRINSTSQYDNIQIETLNHIEASTKFSGWRISSLRQYMKMQVQYGDVAVNNISENFSELNITNQYGNIRLNIDDNASYMLNSECYYCEMSYKVGEIIEQSVEGRKSQLIAKIGSGEARSNVVVKSRYGTINLRD